MNTSGASASKQPERSSPHLCCGQDCFLLLLHLVAHRDGSLWRGVGTEVKVVSARSGATKQSLCLIISGGCFAALAMTYPPTALLPCMNECLPVTNGRYCFSHDCHGVPIGIEVWKAVTGLMPTVKLIGSVEPDLGVPIHDVVPFTTIEDVITGQSAVR